MNVSWLTGLLQVIIFSTLTSCQDVIVIYNNEVTSITGSPIQEPSNTIYAFSNITQAQSVLDRLVSGSGVAVSNICGNLTRDPCHADATCTDAAPSLVQCSCNAGYAQNSASTAFPPNNIVPEGTDCQDIDECSSNKTICGPETAQCSNSIGTYICTCNSGFVLSSSKICEDEDECVTNNNNCHQNATCGNTVGSFTCSCNNGFTGDGTNCVDVDECASSSTCSDVASCHNSVGSFTCTCNVGYSGSGQICEDIDECLSMPCDVEANCTNTNGSFSCMCNIGYAGNGFSCIEANFTYSFRAIFVLNGIPATNPQQKDVLDIIEEMRNFTNNLDFVNVSANIETTRNNGSFTEVIALIIFDGTSLTMDGFQTAVSGHTFSRRIAGLTLISQGDLDECSNNYGDCSNEATCSNTNGGFSCTCPKNMYDASPSSTYRGVICKQPVNNTCHSNRIEVHIIENFLTDLGIGLSELTLGSCTGVDQGELWYFSGDCGGVVTLSSDKSLVVVSWNLTNIKENANITVGNLVTFPISCSFPAIQNVTFNFSAKASEIAGDAQINQLAQSLQAVVDASSSSDFSTTLPTTVGSGDNLHFRVRLSNAVPSTVKLVLDDFWTTPASDQSQRLTLVTGGCFSNSTNNNAPVLDTLKIQSNGDSAEIRLSVGAHFQRDQRTSIASFQLRLCLDDGFGSCKPRCSGKKRKRSLPSFERNRREQNVILAASYAFTRKEEDTCTRDCGQGACVFDAVRREQCVCYDESYKKSDGTCARLGIVEPNPTTTNNMAINNDSKILWILIGLAVLVILLLGLAVFVFVRKRRSAISEKYEVTHVNAHANVN